MTKDQELQRFREIVASLEPGSYLHGLLAGSVDFVADCIRQDMAHSSFTVSFWRQQLEADAKLRETNQEIARKEKELADLERRRQAADQRLCDARRELGDLATKLQRYV